MTINEFITKYKSNDENKKQYFFVEQSMPTTLHNDLERLDLLKLMNSVRKRKKRKPLDTLFFLGNNSNISPMHTDSYHNFYHMLDGEKEVLLVPSKYTKFMRQYAKFNHLKIPDVENIDYKKYPIIIHSSI